MRRYALASAMLLPYACSGGVEVDCAGDDCACFTDADCVISDCPPTEVTSLAECAVECECVSGWVMSEGAANRARASREECCAVPECTDPCLNKFCGEYLILQHARCSAFRCVADAVDY